MVAPRTRLFLLILVAITAVGPLAMQMFIPSLPAIAADFRVSAGVAQLALSLSMVAMAVTTLVYGPVSDRLGRRPVVLAGFVLFLAGSVLCAMAPSVEMLIGGRIVQAVGGAAGMVLSRAIVRDIYDRDGAARAIAYITMAMVLAPMVAPVIGGVLTDLLGWRWIFWSVGLAGVGVMLIAQRFLTETLTVKPQPVSPRAMLGDCRRLLANPAFGGYTFQAAFTMASFFAFMAGAPYVMVNVMGRPATEFGLYFIPLAACYMAGNFAAARLSFRIGLDRMIVIGSLLSLAAAAVAVSLFAAGFWDPWALFAPVALMGIGNGLSMPNAQAGAVSVDPKLAGTAAGLSTSLQFTVAALAAQAVGMMTNGSPYPTVMVMAGCTLAALAAIAVPLWIHRRTAAEAAETQAS